MNNNNKINTGFKPERKFYYKYDFIKALYKYIAISISDIFIKIKISPNNLTFLAGVFGFCGGLLLLIESYETKLAAIVFLQLYIILDFTDGVIARKTNQCSHYGVWLDIFFDKLNDFIIVLCYSIMVYNISQENIHLIASVFMMGSIFFTQFIFLFNDMYLKEIIISENDTKKREYYSKTGNETLLNSLIKKPRVLFKLVLSQISLNHAKFIFLISVFTVLRLYIIGLYIILFLSLLTLSLIIFRNFRMLKATHPR